MVFKVQVLVVVAVVAVGVAKQLPSYGSSDTPAPSIPAQYDFNWKVKDAEGNDFGQQEARDDYEVQGQYYVQQPDGRLQQVTYKVTADSGYVADVKYQGEATYPDPKPAASSKGGYN